MTYGLHGIPLLKSIDTPSLSSGSAASKRGTIQSAALASSMLTPPEVSTFHYSLRTGSESSFHCPLLYIFIDRIISINVCLITVCLTINQDRFVTRCFVPPRIERILLRPCAAVQTQVVADIFAGTKHFQNAILRTVFASFSHLAVA